MTATARTLPDLQTLDTENLMALVVTKHAELAQRDSELASRDEEINNLKLLILKFQRMKFGPSSERFTGQIEQLELQLEDLEATRSASEAAPAQPSPEAAPSGKSKRRPLPAELPRETETHMPKHEACPDCGGALDRLGEDVAEILEFVPARFKVIRIVRPKLSCKVCDCIVQEPAPNRPIDRGLAGPGLLAHVLVSKYADHLPLYRQSEIYERLGVELERSTLADWVIPACPAHPTPYLADPAYFVYPLPDLPVGIWRKPPAFQTYRSASGGSHRLSGLAGRHVIYSFTLSSFYRRSTLWSMGMKTLVKLQTLLAQQFQLLY